MPKKQQRGLEAAAFRMSPLQCATAGCPNEARVRVRERVCPPAGKFNKETWRPYPGMVESLGAWLNLCYECDDKRIHASAKAKQFAMPPHRVA